MRDRRYFAHYNDDDDDDEDYDDDEEASRQYCTSSRFFIAKSSLPNCKKVCNLRKIIVPSQVIHSCK